MSDPAEPASAVLRILPLLRRQARAARHTWVGANWPSMEAMRRDGIGAGLVEKPDKDPAIRRFVSTFSPEMVGDLLDGHRHPRRRPPVRPSHRMRRRTAASGGFRPLAVPMSAADEPLSAGATEDMHPDAVYERQWEPTVRGGLDRFGWLIERGQVTGYPTTEWFDGEGWTTDAWSALWFADRRSAQQFIDQRTTPPGYSPFGIAVEHGFALAPHADPEP